MGFILNDNIHIVILYIYSYSVYKWLYIREKTNKNKRNINNNNNEYKPTNQQKNSYETENKKWGGGVWGGGSIILTCHNWSTGDVVVKELSKVGQIWREAGADLDLIVTVMDHITHPPGAREGVAVYTLNPRHFDP